MAGLQKSGRLSRNDKRWLSAKLEEEHKHQRNMVFTQALGDNPDLPYILMFLGGISSAAVADLIERIASGKLSEEEDKSLKQELAGYLENASDIMGFFSFGLTGWAVQEVLIGQKLKTIYEGDNPKSWVEYAVSSVKAISAGTAAFAATILTLRAIFGNSTKDGGMANLAGLVVP